MKMISFDVSKKDNELIRKIIDRACKLLPTFKRDKISITMDVVACHANGNPLDLQKLLEFPDFDFMHDIVGINRHLNRKTGKLMSGFSPRSSAHEQEE